MNQNELNKILENHKLWLNDGPSGRRADLTNAKLWYADLTNADLTNADLEFANLPFADLENAILTNAILTNADLRNAILSGAILSDAILSGAILRNANLKNADLKNADLSDADLEFANLSGATFNKETVFPKGFDPVSCGMKLVGEKAPEAPSPTKQEEVVVVAAVPAAPKTLHEELSEVLAKHGLILGKTVTISINLLG